MSEAGTSASTREASAAFPATGGATVGSAVFAVFVTAGLHTLCTAATALPGVLAPIASRDLGIEPSRVGLMQAMHYLTTVFTGLVAVPLMARWGPVRVLQFTACTTGLAAASCGVAGLVAGTGALPTSLIALWLMATGVLFGTGYGMITTVSSNVLFAATPPSMRSLIFSIKQTAVPVGFGLSGLLFPLLLLWLPWTWVAITMGVVLFTLAAALARVRLAVQDVAVARHALLHWTDFSGPLRDVLLDPMWRRRALMAVAYSTTQTAVVAYMVTFLSVEIGLTLAVAGGVYAVAQMGGVGGRIGLGLIADRWVRPQLQLGLVGLFTAAACMAMVTVSKAWPVAGITALCVVLGALSFAWNGTFMAMTAASAPEGKIGHFTGGIQVFIGLGAMIGPALFALILSLSSNYGLAFVLIALPTVSAAVMMLLPGTAAASRKARA